MAFYLISQLTSHQSNMPALCLPSDQTTNIAIYTSLKTAYEQELHYFKQIALEDETITYSLDDIKKALTDDSIAIIGQEILTEYAGADHNYYTKEITRIVLQKFQKDTYLY